MDISKSIEADFQKLGLASASERARFNQYSKPAQPQTAQFRVVVSTTSQPFGR
jgi:hypothetical protein